MIKHAFIFSTFFLSILNAAQIQVNTQTAFRTDTKTIDCVHDTLVFSNGIDVFRIAIRQYPFLPSLQPSFSSAICFYETDRHIGCSETTSDTIWANAVSIPAGTVKLDSLVKYNTPGVPSFVGFGKRVHNYYLPEAASFGCINSQLNAGYNSIIYLKSNGGGSPNYKMQVVSVLIDTSRKWFGGTDSCTNISIDSIVLRWTIDSLGNGVFKENFSTIKRGSNRKSDNRGLKKIIGKKMLDCKIVLEDDSENEPAYYDVFGRRYLEKTLFPHEGPKR